MVAINGKRCDWADRTSQCLQLSCRRDGVCDLNLLIDAIHAGKRWAQGVEIISERLSGPVVIKNNYQPEDKPEPFVEPKTKWGLD